MEDWQYRFPQVTKDEWITRVTTDLNGKSIASLDSEWWPGESRHPVHHKEDIITSPVFLSKDLFASPPILMEWIDVRNKAMGEINSEILQALKHGTQSLILYIGTDVNAILSFSEMLEGVFTDIISINMEVDDIFASDHYNLPLQGRLPIQTLTEAGNKIFPPFVVDIPSQGAWTTQTADIFQRLIRIHAEDERYHSILHNCIFRFCPDTDFLKQLIQTRVIHIVWQKILSVHNVDVGTSQSYLEYHIQPGDQNDPDKYLIQASSSALAASMTGVHSICIHHIAGNTPGYYKRINRNISHLLELESEMYKGVDPMAGSYAIEYYTQKWSRDIFDKLDLEISK